MRREPTDAERRDNELTRMLLWFKDQLPTHDLGGWMFEFQPSSTWIINESPNVVTSDSMYDGHITGSGTCQRCGRVFQAPRIGNLGVLHNTPEEIERRLETAKEWIQREADTDGECWGDVPPFPDHRGPIAILDTVASHQGS